MEKRAKPQTFVTARARAKAKARKKCAREERERSCRTKRRAVIFGVSPVFLFDAAGMVLVDEEEEEEVVLALLLLEALNGRGALEEEAWSELLVLIAKKFLWFCTCSCACVRCAARVECKCALAMLTCVHRMSFISIGTKRAEHGQCQNRYYVFVCYRCAFVLDFTSFECIQVLS